MTSLASCDRTYASRPVFAKSSGVFPEAFEATRDPAAGVGCEIAHVDLLTPAPRRDAVLIVLHIRDFHSYVLWVDRSRAPIDVAPDPARGTALFVDPGAPRLRHDRWFHFYVPRSMPAVSVERDDVGEPGVAPYPPCVLVSDTVVERLGQCLVDAAHSAVKGHRRLLGYLLLSLHVHLAQTYGDLSVQERPTRGGLAQWQELRAKQIMSENLNGSVSVEELAAACRLSPSHFARAFKTTTGQSPHRWLLACRVERAKRLLLESGLTLVEIALSCGFADQSHFARIFCRLAGTPPGAWRRSCPKPN